MKKTTYQLLTGTLWIPDETRITQLRQQYDLPPSKLANLKTAVTCSSQPVTAAVTIPAIKPALIETVKPAPVIEKPKIIMPPPVTVENHGSKIPQPPATHHSWQELVHEISNCDKCKLCHGRTNIVIERGNRNGAWMFIGEGPGEQEDLQGKPFVGASGQLLDKMIAAMKLDAANDIYIANVVKCRPPHNRNPEAEEISACSDYLMNQIRLVNPRIIITLGRFAAQTLLNTELAIGKLRKQVQYYRQIPVIVTYHPSYLLRTPSAKKDAWEDLQLAMQTFANLPK